jgi:hypothetical protein
MASSRERSARLEAFGAIVQLRRPRALAFVDRAWARRRLGVPGSPRWDDPEADGVIGATPLSAPLEAHLQLTNRCGAGCTGCYTGASPAGAPGEWGLAEWRAAIDELAAAGVFHVALGGGESATLPWLGDLARHARARGLVPNLTTSGLDGLRRLLPIAHLFGQINVSLDGLGATYAAVRGFDGFARADAALVALRLVKREVGINVVVTRHNVHQLDDDLRARAHGAAWSRGRAAPLQAGRARRRRLRPGTAAPTPSTARSCRRCSPPRDATGSGSSSTARTRR